MDGAKSLGGKSADGVLTKTDRQIWGRRFLSGESERGEAFESVASKPKLSNLSTVKLTKSVCQDQLL